MEWSAKISECNKMQKRSGAEPEACRRERIPFAPQLQTMFELIAISLLFVEFISRSLSTNTDLHLPMKPLTTTYLQCIYKLSRTCKMLDLRAPL